MAKTWKLYQRKQKPNFQTTLSLIFRPLFSTLKSKEEVINNYSCFYKKENNSLCFLIEEHAKVADFSKEIMLNLMELSRKLEIDTIYLLINRKNKEYIKILQGMLTVGFEQEQQMKTAKIGVLVYKVLKMELKEGEEIEELDF